jgi:hypothetical protein
MSGTSPSQSPGAGVSSDPEAGAKPTPVAHDMSLDAATATFLEVIETIGSRRILIDRG